MPNHLFFDGETTGVNPKKDRLVQLAWILTDNDGKYIYEKSEIIKPDNFQIPKQCFISQMGITDERAQREGKPLRTVLNQFSESLLKAKKLVAHNIHFDCGFIIREDEKANAFEINTLRYFHQLQRICTMNDHRIKKHLGTKKRISLKNLHFTLFNQNFENAHDALADTRACARCFFELKNRHVL